MRKVVVYIAASVDGYIAGTNGDMSFLDIVQQEGEDYGYVAFLDTVDTVIMGRKTYDWVMEQVPVFPHTNLTSYIITRTNRPTVGNIRFYTGNLKELVNKLKNEDGATIFVDGGAEIVQTLLDEGLIDELILSVIPILVGGGVRLFKDGLLRQSLELISAKSFESGLVQVHYKLLD